MERTSLTGNAIANLTKDIAAVRDAIANLAGTADIINSPELHGAVRALEHALVDVGAAGDCIDSSGDGHTQL